jgi:hypothetical protein
MILTAAIGGAIYFLTRPVPQPVTPLDVAKQIGREVEELVKPVSRITNTGISATSDLLSATMGKVQNRQNLQNSVDPGVTIGVYNTNPPTAPKSKGTVDTVVGWVTGSWF